MERTKNIFVEANPQQEQTNVLGQNILAVVTIIRATIVN